MSEFKTRFAAIKSSRPLMGFLAFAGLISSFAFARDLLSVYGMRKAKKALRPDDLSLINAAIERAVRTSSSPEFFAKSLFQQKIYVIYKRENNKITGASFGRQNIPGRYSGQYLGWPWQKIEDNLHQNAWKQQ